MASSVVIREFRGIIGDETVHTFNQATADGVNASWQLTNSPVVPATHSLFLDGVPQQNGVSDTTTTTVINEGDTSFNVVSANNLAVGLIIAFSDDPDPQKFKITTIDGETITVNQPSEEIIAANTLVYIMTLDYSINTTYGIIFFDSAPTLNVIMTARYQYTKYTDTQINAILTQASNEVSIDIGEAVDIDTNTEQKTLVFLKAYSKLLNKEVTRGASSAIKIKQGSTSLDLGGSTQILHKQLLAIGDSYEEARVRYMMNQVNGNLGDGVVGDEAYIN